MSENDTDGMFHDETCDKPLAVHIPGCEDMSLSFVGREDYQTVTCYAIDRDNPWNKVPLFEVKLERFEFLLEQASGAKIDAEEA